MARTGVVGRWQLEAEIGSGSFAVVWRARHQETGQLAAVKEINTDKLNRKLQESLASEVHVLDQTKHPNIVGLLDLFKEGNRIYLVLEYCSGGDLGAYIRRYGRVSEATARYLAAQLTAGLRELRRHNVIHRDLKPQNLLLSDTSGRPLLKIADFGFAKALEPQGLAETLCGSPLYMAPEILQLQKYDAKADLWSIGTILFELLSGKPPFNGANHMQLLRNIERSEARLPDSVQQRVSPECAALIHGLLKRNPVQRMSWEELFAHPWLQQAPPGQPGEEASIPPPVPPPPPARGAAGGQPWARPGLSAAPAAGQAQQQVPMQQQPQHQQQPGPSTQAAAQAQQAQAQQAQAEQAEPRLQPQVQPTPAQARPGQQPAAGPPPQQQQQPPQRPPQQQHWQASGQQPGPGGLQQAQQHPLAPSPPLPTSAAPHGLQLSDSLDADYVLVSNPFIKAGPSAAPGGGGSGGSSAAAASAAPAGGPAGSLPDGSGQRGAAPTPSASHSSAATRAAAQAALPAHHAYAWFGAAGGQGDAGGGAPAGHPPSLGELGSGVNRAVALAAALRQLAHLLAPGCFGSMQGSMHEVAAPQLPGTGAHQQQQQAAEAEALALQLLGLRLLDCLCASQPEVATAAGGDAPAAPAGQLLLAGAAPCELDDLSEAAADLLGCIQGRGERHRAQRDAGSHWHQGGGGQGGEGEGEGSDAPAAAAALPDACEVLYARALVAARAAAVEELMGAWAAAVALYGQAADLLLLLALDWPGLGGAGLAVLAPPERARLHQLYLAVLARLVECAEEAAVVAAPPTAARP